MRRRVLEVIVIVLLVAVTLAAEPGKQILLQACDLKGQALSGFRFAFELVKSRSTNRKGATELDLPPKHTPGRKIAIQLVPSARQAKQEWFLVNSEINIPNASDSATVVLIRRSEFRQFAADVREAAKYAIGADELTAEIRKRVLIETAARYGLSADQLETALSSFAETQDPKDRGIAAYLDGQYAQAENFLTTATEKKESDLVETLRYLGATQFAQGKYQAVVDTFHKAVALRGEDAELLSWLGEALRRLAEWTKAEPLMRQALAIDEKRFGPEHPNVAKRLNNLSLLLYDTNRLSEAELVLRRALAIDEKNFGPDHPDLIEDLDNLALLLHETDRLAEAEPLMRRALAIGEKKFGPDHLEVAASLNNLAQLLHDTGRFAEAETLMRRTLTIDEKNLEPNHPDIARDLNNLASLLYDTKRLVEAEPLMRRVVTIFESKLGENHPSVATALNNLAVLLETMDRPVEAEPLLRRALAIDEKSSSADHPLVARDLNSLAAALEAMRRYTEAESQIRRGLAINEKAFGPDHINVAISLNSLARLLQEMERLAEAEPLLRRALAIFLEFKRRNGNEHQHQAQVTANYRSLLKEMGKSDAEIAATIEELARSSE